MTPEFAILGHPNEGKSSVLSTLSEDDSVKISPIPGETVQCRTFPVLIDGREVIRFTDTPGFQNPSKVLHLLQQKQEIGGSLLESFYTQHQNDPQLQHDCELLKPLIRGAGIIYVADGSRPLRNVDLAEMEILRLTGKPRMAILNCKDREAGHIDDWKTEFRKNFNSSRVFNAHSATYHERIKLLEALKSIDQDWHEALDFVVSAFKRDWLGRNQRTTELICQMLTSCVNLKLEKSLSRKSSIEPEKEKLYLRYTEKIKKLERSHHAQIRKLFKHNIFDYTLPAQSIYHQDLFSEQTWQVLGLTRKQLALVGGIGGAALAATVDIAAGGASLGFFTTMGGALGALGAVYGGKKVVSKIDVLGISPEKYILQVGPNENTQFPFILFDRVLLYYSHIINWTHGRRDYKEELPVSDGEGFSGKLPVQSLKIVSHYFRLLQKDPVKAADHEQQFRTETLNILERLSNRRSDEEDSQNGKNPGQALDR